MSASPPCGLPFHSVSDWLTVERSPDPPTSVDPAGIGRQMSNEGSAANEITCRVGRGSKDTRYLANNFRAVPAACPIGSAAEGSGGHSRTNSRRSRRSAKPEVRSEQRLRLPKLTVRVDSRHPLHHIRPGQTRGPTSEASILNTTQREGTSETMANVKYGVAGEYRFIGSADTDALMYAPTGTVLVRMHAVELLPNGPANGTACGREYSRLGQGDWESPMTSASGLMCQDCTESVGAGKS
jgi:hypothetical protein